MKNWKINEILEDFELTNQLKPFHAYGWKMAKHTLKILQIVKVYLAIIQHYHEGIKKVWIPPKDCISLFSVLSTAKMVPKKEGVHLTLPPHIFPSKWSHGACYITGQWGSVQSKIKETLP